MLAKGWLVGCCEDLERVRARLIVRSVQAEELPWQRQNEKEDRMDAWGERERGMKRIRCRIRVARATPGAATPK